MMLPTTADAALESRDDLEPYGDDARSLFALQIEFQIEDIAAVATDAIVDGSDDKGVDIVYLDDVSGRIVVAQNYEASKVKSAAKSNKAAALGHGVQWLFAKPLPEVPDRLRSAASLARSAVMDGSATSIEVWYVHNCQESKNVGDELEGVRNTLSAILKAEFPTQDIDVSCREIGRSNFASLYQSTQVAIEVQDEFELEVRGAYEEFGDQWSAVNASVPGQWLADRLGQYGESLFSANVRGYLGSRRSDLNINNGIKNTAVSMPGDFWVFNNGVTALVNDFSVEREGPNEGAKLSVTGLAIVNGAQTTGSLASSNADLSEVSVMTRFVKCSNPKLIRQIIRYTNRQNRVEVVDFRSNDVIQTRLRGEFKDLGDFSYSGGRRGGVEDIIRRPGNLDIPASTASQALAAFHGHPNLAYNGKSQIWELDHQYSRFFREVTTANHILFCYSLYKSIEVRKSELRQLSEEDRTDSERTQIDFLSRRGSPYLLTAAIGAGLESIIDRHLPS